MDLRRLYCLWVTNLSLLLCAAVLPAQQIARTFDTNLSRAIDSILASPDLQTGFQGIDIESLTDHTLIYERNADQVFLPASNNKLLTSCAALEILGPRYSYHTRVYRSGVLSADGNLAGDIILCGAGDPLLSSADMETLAAKVHASGIERINGNVRYDDSRFDRQWLGDNWAWDDESYGYAAQVSALNVNENVITVRVSPGRKVGERVRVSVLPLPHYVTITNKAKTGPRGMKSTLEIERDRGLNTVSVRGALPVDQLDPLEFTITIENPARFAAALLADDLRRTGVRVDHQEITDAPAIAKDAQIICDRVSPSLAELLPKLNKPSDNLFAECLLKTIGAERSGMGSSGANGTGPISARGVFRQMGLDMSRVQQVDGSGLSRKDFVSPRNLVRLLSYASTRPYFQVLYDSLPSAGIDGTLAGRMKGTPAAGNCHAKTGTLSTVSCLSGYVTAADGEMLAFSILMNNHLAGNRACTAAQDRIVTLLANYTHQLSKQVTKADERNHE